MIKIIYFIGWLILMLINIVLFCGNESLNNGLFNAFWSNCNHGIDFGFYLFISFMLTILWLNLYKMRKLE